MPLAPVIIVAVRAPEFKTSTIAFHDCSSVRVCKSRMICVGVVAGLFGIRLRMPIARRVVLSCNKSGENSSDIISAMSVSLSCFICLIRLKFFYKKSMLKIKRLILLMLGVKMYFVS